MPQKNYRKIQNNINPPIKNKHKYPLNKNLPQGDASSNNH